MSVVESQININEISDYVKFDLQDEYNSLYALENHIEQDLKNQLYYIK